MKQVPCAATPSAISDHKLEVGGIVWSVHRWRGVGIVQASQRQIPGTFSIDGTSFNPNSGAVKGLSTLDANLEVCGNSKKAFAFGTQLWIHVQLCC